MFLTRSEIASSNKRPESKVSEVIRALVKAGANPDPTRLEQFHGAHERCEIRQSGSCPRNFFGQELIRMPSERSAA